jgi:hypothetical protein
LPDGICIFKPKIQWSGCHILWPFGLFYGHLVYLMVIWYIFPRFGVLSQRQIWQPWSFLVNRSRNDKLQLR